MVTGWVVNLLIYNSPDLTLIFRCLYTSARDRKETGRALHSNGRITIVKHDRGRGVSAGVNRVRRAGGVEEGEDRRITVFF